MLETDNELVVEGLINYKNNGSNPDKKEKSNNGKNEKDKQSDDNDKKDKSDSGKTESDKQSDDKDNRKKIEINKQEIFAIYVIVVVIITMLIFLINIRGFIIPAVGKDWFLPVFLISISFILITILVVGYQNHIKIEDDSLRLFLVFFFIVQSVILLIIISQFFTHGNTRAPALLSGLLSIMILIWFLLSYKSKVRYLLLIYSFLMLAFAFLLLRTKKIVE